MTRQAGRGWKGQRSTTVCVLRFITGRTLNDTIATWPLSVDGSRCRGKSPLLARLSFLRHNKWGHCHVMLLLREGSRRGADHLGAKQRAAVPVYSKQPAERWECSTVSLSSHRRFFKLVDSKCCRHMLSRVRLCSKPLCKVKAESLP